MHYKASLFILITVAFLFTLAEISLRKLLGYSSSSKNFISEKSLLESNDAVIYDSLLSWRHKPSIISENGLNTDKNGFRISRKFTNHDLLNKKIFVSGDSFAAGAEVKDHETWPFNLEKLTRYNVINSAVGGWDSFQIIQNVIKNYKIVKPDIVIVQFTDAIERSKYNIYSSAYKTGYKIENNSLKLTNYPVKEFRKNEFLNSSNSSIYDKFANSKFCNSVLGGCIFPVKLIFDHSLFLYKAQKKLFNPPYGLNFDKVYVKDEYLNLEKNCMLMNELSTTLNKENIRLITMIQHKGDTIYQSKKQSPNLIKFEKCITKSGIEVLNLYTLLKNKFEADEIEFKKLFNIKKNKYFGHMLSYGNLYISEIIKDEFF